MAHQRIKTEIRGDFGICLANNPITMQISPSWVQALSTIILVTITGYYAWQMKNNVELLEKQYNRDRKRQHTEVLRTKINEWLDNLPEVRTADVRLPTIIDTVGHDVIERDETEFWCVPISLQDDHTFEHLLESHAQDLEEVKSDINDTFYDFDDARRSFYEEFDDYTPIETLPFDTEPMERFSLWAFKQAMHLERGRDSVNDLKNEIENVVHDDNLAVHQPAKQYPGDHDGRRILRAWVVEEDEYGHEYVRDGADEEVADALKEVIDRLEDQPEYEYAEDAAGILSELEVLVDSLEHKLEEYKVKDPLPGECDWINGSE